MAKANSNNSESYKDNAKECYVAFIDIIGFSEIMEKEPESAKRVISILHHWHDQIPKIEQLNFPNPLEFKSISDSIIVFTLKENTHLISFLHLIGNLQADFLREKILLRGAISVGEIYKDSKLDILLGSGIIQAYKLEKLANVPRIIIDPKLVFQSGYNNKDFCIYIGKMTIRQSGSMIFNFNLLKESDMGRDKMKYVHIDYTKLFIIEQLVFSSNPNYPPDFKSIFEFIKECIYNKQVAIEKYYWLANEFTDSFYLFLKDSHFKKCNVKESYLPELRLYEYLYRGI